MSTAFEQHRQRSRAAALLGRPLARRAGSRCELCGTAGVPLLPWEVPPEPEEPEVERAVLLCGRCLEGATGGVLDETVWRFLETVVWSELLPVQVTAVRLARRLAASGSGWAADLVDGLWLCPEAESWLAGS